MNVPDNFILEASNTIHCDESSQINVSVLTYYLDLAYAVGFEKGIHHNSAHKMKPVCYMNESGNVITFESIREASRKMKCNHSNIIRSIETGGKCRGFRWYFAEVL